MRNAAFRMAALATLASLGLATSADAGTILQFGQTNPNDVVTAQVSGSTTTLVTNSALAPGSIPVLITNIGGTVLGTPIAAFETFTNVTSTGVATTASGTIEQRYSGTIAITSGPGGTGGNILTATFTNASLSGLSGGGSASLVGSSPPGTVTFTSNFAAIVPLLGGSSNFSISFSGIPTPPGLSVSGTTVAGFTAQNTGTFATATAVPEPASVVSASTAILAGLGCFGWRRLRASRV